MDLKAIWQKILIIFSDLWPLIWPSIKVFLTDEGKFILSTTANVVKQIQESMPTATGAEKAAAALAQITAILVAQGIPAMVAEIKLCIEIAYQHMMASEETQTEAKEMSDLFKGGLWDKITGMIPAPGYEPPPMEP